MKRGNYFITVSAGGGFFQSTEVEGYTFSLRGYQFGVRRSGDEWTITELLTGHWTASGKTRQGAIIKLDALLGSNPTGWIDQFINRVLKWQAGKITKVVTLAQREKQEQEYEIAQMRRSMEIARYHGEL